MSRDNTARQLILLLPTTDAPAQTKRRVRQRPSGIGLLAAVLVSLTMWAGLIALGFGVVGLLSR